LRPIPLRITPVVEGLQVPVSAFFPKNSPTDHIVYSNASLPMKSRQYA